MQKGDKTKKFVFSIHQKSNFTLGNLKFVVLTMLAFGFPLLASASEKSMCLSIFSNAGSVTFKSDNVEKKISRIIDRDLNLENSYQNPFSRLIEDLDKIYRESIYSEKSINYRNALLAWKALQEKALAKWNDITYHEYVELNSLYMLITDDIVTKMPINFERSRKIAKKIADILASNYPHLVYIFTPRILGVREFNNNSGEPIFYIGLTNQKVYVDLTRMKPMNFYIHDMNHALASLNLFGDSIPRGYSHLGFNEDYTFQRFPAFELTRDQKKDIVFWTPKNIELRNRIFASLEAKSNSRLTSAVNSIWFFIYHERSLRMTEHDLKTELIRLSQLSDDLIYMTADRAMVDPINMIYYFFKETMESQGINDREQIIIGIREGIQWMLAELG